MARLVAGKGINDLQDVSKLKSYAVWNTMLRRCYAPRGKDVVTYQGCFVCDEWLTYSVFKAWYDYHSVDGWGIDKDLYVEGNKEYRPDRCFFVPNALNALFTGPKSSTPGVYKHNRTSKPYEATLRVNSGDKRLQLGSYATVEEASAAYQAAKADHVVKELAKYRSEGVVSTVLLDAIEKRLGQ
ncbi:HNH endonuclease [Vibrio phage D528]